MTASPGLSSTRRMRVGTAGGGWQGDAAAASPRTRRGAFLLGGELDEGEPEVVDGADDAEELVEVHGLGDVAVRREVVGGGDVVLALRGRQDDDGDPLELVVGLEVGEDFAAVFPRHVEVEEDEVRARAVGELALAAEEAEGLLAVARDVEVVGDLRIPEGFDGQRDV